MAAPAKPFVATRVAIFPINLIIRLLRGPCKSLYMGFFVYLAFATRVEITKRVT